MAAIDQKLIDRINVLAKKKKEGTITPEELKEQDKLRKEYIKLFREGFKSQLKAIKVVDEKGNPIYTKVVPSWDHSIYVLMKYYNDTSLNRDAQSPYQTSTVDVIYKGMLYDGTPFDSSYLRTDSIYRTQVKQNIKGWIIALEQMKVGDSCRVIIPQTLGYGAQYMSSLILPYTTLVFDMKLVDIPGLDKPVTE